MKNWIHPQDIKLFKIFYELANAGGYSQAQVKLNISQSSLSTYITQLENRVGMRLCTRGHAGFKLTDDGNMLFEEIHILFEAFEAFTTRVSNKKNEIAGDLFLGILENTITHPDQKITQALGKMQDVAPNVLIDVYTAGALELETRVLDGRLHGAIGLFPHRIESLEYRPLFSESHHLYCAKGHPLYEVDDVEMSLEELANYSYISRDYVDQIEGLEPPEQFNYFATARHMEGLIFLLLTGQYFGYLPDHTAKTWVNQGRMRRINALNSKRVAQFMLTVRKDKLLPRSLKEFITIFESI